jgi:hypothetical protein
MRERIFFKFCQGQPSKGQGECRFRAGLTAPKSRQTRGEGHLGRQSRPTDEVLDRRQHGRCEPEHKACASISYFEEQIILE